MSLSSSSHTNMSSGWWVQTTEVNSLRWNDRASSQESVPNQIAHLNSLLLDTWWCDIDLLPDVHKQKNTILLIYLRTVKWLRSSFVRLKMCNKSSSGGALLIAQKYENVAQCNIQNKTGGESVKPQRCLRLKGKRISQLKENVLVLVQLNSSSGLFNKNKGNKMNNSPLCQRWCL